MIPRTFYLLCLAAVLLAAAAAARGQTTVAVPAASAASGAAAAPLAPVVLDAAQLYEPPRYSGVTLSPDGRWLALSLRTPARRVIALVDTRTQALSVLAQDPQADLVQPVWVNATRLVYRERDERVTPMNDRTGAVHAIDVDGGRARRLWDSVAQWQAQGRGPWRPLTLLGPGDPAAQELLVTLTDRAPPGTAARFPGSDVYALDTLSARRRLLTLDNPGEVQAWFADQHHRIRAALSMRADQATGMARYQTWYRDDAAAPWRLLAEHAMDAPGHYPAGFDRDGAFYTVGRDREDTLGLQRWDLTRGRPGKLVLRHARADIGAQDLLFSADRRLVGVDVKAMRPERHFFDADEAALQADIDQALPGRHNRITRRGAVALVESSADTDPGTLYLYDTPARRLQRLFAYLPGLPEAALSPKRAIGYRARDGRDIPAYLTLPRQRPPGRLPLVVLVHGGPAERDHWGDYWEENEPLVQLLAARGHAVLQPQYRGSAGFGWALHRAGWKQWADGSIDDLADGVQHLVAQGIADGTRVCTMGKSAGGYSALYAVIRHPALWRCGIAWAATTEMELFWDEPNASYAGSAWLATMAPWTHVAPHEADYMARASVVRNAQHIRVPVLLAYGTADSVVPLSHGERLRQALQRHGRPAEWMLFEGEGHGWSLPAHRIEFARAVERFLARQLAPRAETAP